MGTSQNAVIFFGAHIFFINVKMPRRKDARTSEKPFKRHLILPFLINNPWRFLAITWFS